MRIALSLGFIICLASGALPVFGQGVNGTITGTISDPSGLAVAGATVEAKNVETGALYNAASTNTGNYAVPNLPVGTYTLTATVPGFKTYSHTNLTIAAAQIVREDIALQVGAATESVTVQAEASLLKTETGEMTHNVTLKEMDELPILSVLGGVRNPYDTLSTLPGAAGGAGSYVMNGLGFATPGSGGRSTLVPAFRVDGQDSTPRMYNTFQIPSSTQPNVDAVQEVAIQTSNYAPEFGQGGSMVINMTMKSGTNQFHGSAFEYLVNEDLNAGYPFSSDGHGGKFRPTSRRNDFGGTLGGPIRIPKVYDGRDKTFFFWSYEQYLFNTLYGYSDTVPTAAYRNGDFSAISPNGTCSLCAAYGIPTGPLGGASSVDALGRPQYANEIFDPASRGILSNGLQYANPFSNNVIPASRFNSTALAMQALFPAPGNNNLVANYSGRISGGTYQAIPALKIDELLSAKDKLSFYWSKQNSETPIGPAGAVGGDGLPIEIGQYRGSFIKTNTERLSYDRTLTPTLLLHLGAGYLHTTFDDHAPFLNFDPSAFGLSGFLLHRQFPLVTGQSDPSYGGMQNIGTTLQFQGRVIEERPSFNANATWVKGNHTFKIGAELELQANLGYTQDYPGVTMTTGVGPTAQPFQPSVSFNGYNAGFGYASFLLGDFTSVVQTPNVLGQKAGYQNWGLFAQDSWKITRKLTVDYGLRWDYATPQHEQYNRLGRLDPTLANPNAGGRLGAIQYASTCNCNFYEPSYPYAIGPRLGVAYQITPKTVFRGGWGVSYQFVGEYPGTLFSTPGTTPIAPLPNNSQYVNISSPGSILSPVWPTTDPFVAPIPGTIGGLPPRSNGGPGSIGAYAFWPDANENRPPRINQWSVGFQREITRNFLVEASYVGNRGVWLNDGPLAFLSSQISPQTYAHYGLFPFPGTGPCTSGGGVCSSSTYNNDGDRFLLTQPLSSAAVQSALAARGFPNLLPYSGFPLGNSLQSALYPYPQFGNIGVTGSPSGATKYDSLQVKVTKRLSHGLQANGAFTWGQGFIRPPRQDFYNPASTVWALQNIPPVALTFNAIYTVQSASFLPKYVNALSKDWQLGWFSRYQSGAYLQPPVSTQFANYLQSEMIRVPGQPLYTPGVDINDHSTFNANYTQVLNPKAWAPCPTNSVCPSTSVLYKDFHGPRIPQENLNVGRHFRLGKERKYDFYLRAEFVNIFNRTLIAIPTTTTTTPAGAMPSFTANPQNAPAKGAGGGTIYTAGFGVLSNAYLLPGATYANAGRTGTLIGRFTF